MFQIDRTSSTAPFEQLRMQVIAAITSEALPVGAKLPTVRALATDLSTAPGTVARAYRELEEAGVVETRGRNGTFVSAHGDANERSVQVAAAEFAAVVKSMQVEPERAISLVRAALSS